jgi:hypothetical protein
MPMPRAELLRRLVLLAVTALLAFAPAQAAPAGSRHPGFLSVQPFLDLAGPDDDVTEVNVGPELLRAIAKGMADPELRRMLDGIAAVHAVVIGLSGEGGGRVDRARHLVADTTERLIDSGWETLVRVREKSSTVSVLTKAAGAAGKVEGLAVLVVDTESDGPEVVFANIAGTLDMSQMRRLSAGIKLPGLDQLEGLDED